jgi:hypothetical protein
MLSLGLMIVGLLATLFLKEIPLKGGRLTEKVEAQDGDEFEVESTLAAIL